jgi:hypothetical protein
LINLSLPHRVSPLKGEEFQLLPSEALAKVSNGHPPQPLPSREGLIYQPSPLVGEGKGEGVIEFCKSLLLLIHYFIFHFSLAKGCALSYISIRCVISRWVYFCVVESDEWPKSSCIILRSAPP